ncbi:MAG: hypothetical protein NTU83_02045 [Candidatus Hydrogenedentes bacterium]|nr:hypothetical protein [Candidatus Hydrogenedentota bacterium]
MRGTPNELKQLPDVTPEGMLRLELRCPRAPYAMRLLNTFSYVQDATIFGDVLHVLATMGAESRIAQDLAGGGFDGVEVRPIKPTLEDVFVTLTRSRDLERSSQ